MNVIQPVIPGLSEKVDVCIGYRTGSLVGMVIAYRLDGGAYCVHPFI